LLTGSRANRKLTVVSRRLHSLTSTSLPGVGFERNDSITMSGYFDSHRVFARQPSLVEVRRSARAEDGLAPLTSMQRPIHHEKVALAIIVCLGHDDFRVFGP